LHAGALTAKGKCPLETLPQDGHIFAVSRCSITAKAPFSISKTCLLCRLFALTAASSAPQPWALIRLMNDDTVRDGDLPQGCAFVTELTADFETRLLS